MLITASHSTISTVDGFFCMNTMDRMLCSNLFEAVARVGGLGRSETFIALLNFGSITIYVRVEYGRVTTSLHHTPNPHAGSR